ncbi:MAG: thiamine phosphate synthase [Bacteroidales bacterium]|nr:thiamine phosphate synthase [Bacteroidales bacterium]
MNLEHFRFQFITHYTEKYSYIDSARLALEGGCRWIQLRMKDADENLFEETALVVQQMCKEYNATFIIDDNVHLCKKIKADGVHLGKNDMPVAEARKILGSDFIIGGTVNSIEDILKIIDNTQFGTSTSSVTGNNSQWSKANSQKTMVNYFGCGPFRFTSTKKNLAPILGLEGYKNILKKMKENDINIPLVAIGGITKDDIPELLKTGVDGIAMSGSILRAEKPINEINNVQFTMNNVGAYRIRSCRDA